MIRVLRLMEYEFQNSEQMEWHMSQAAVPFNGSKDFGRGMIRSATILNFNSTPASLINIEDEDTE